MPQNRDVTKMHAALKDKKATRNRIARGIVLLKQGVPTDKIMATIRKETGIGIGAGTLQRLRRELQLKNRVKRAAVTRVKNANAAPQPLNDVVRTVALAYLHSLDQTQLADVIAELLRAQR